MSEQQSFITTCPECQTAFRVTEEQIEMADGAVRCGACLRVFQAVPEPALDPPPQPDTSEITDLFWQHWFTYVSELTQSAVGAGSTDNTDTNGTDGLLAGNPEMQESVDIDIPHEAIPLEASPLEDRDQEDEHLNEMVSRMDLGQEEASFVSQSQPAKRSLLAGFSVLVLLLAVASQFLWFNRDTLAQQPELRSWYLAFCQTASCSLREYSDASKLTTTRLIVRSHPTVSGALVDAILKNSAQFKQLFPQVQLQFVDIRNKVVAARRFRPAEYLAGELKGLHYIPPATEVRFSLEILDPGKNALGYNMQVVPADQPRTTNNF